jgi:ribosomal protein S14
MYVTNTIVRENPLYRKLERGSDRCDRCSAPANFRAVKANDVLLELLLCGHHFREHSYGLGLDGWSIQTENEE